MQQRERGRLDNGWKILSFFLVAVIIIAAILIGVFTATGDIRFGQDEEQDNTAAIGGEDGELVGGGSYAFQDMTFVSARSLTTDVSGGTTRARTRASYSRRR